MPETTSANFIAEKDKLENKPIILHEIEYDDTHTGYFCEYDIPIVYPDPAGPTYTPANVKHEGIGANAFGEIDAVHVHFSTVDRTIIQTLESYGALKGKKWTIRIVFANQLADANANLSATYYIDSVATTELEADFYITSRLDLYLVQIPGRVYSRDHCGFTFKEEGCWLWNGSAYEAPAGFLHADVECDHTRSGLAGCKYHANSSRMGATPGIPARGLILT